MVGRRTKIVATIGPASDPPAVLRLLLEAGANVARIGLAHGPLEASLDRIHRVREAARDVGRPVGILVDLPGPKVRSAPFDEDGVTLDTGADIRLTEAQDGDTSTAEVIAVVLPGAVDTLAAGDRVALGDGGVALVVSGRDHHGDVHATVEAGGVLRGRPGVALPANRIPLRSPTDADLEMLEGVLAVEIDAVAVSFVQNGEDIAAVRLAIADRGPMIIAKVETGPAVDNLDDILATADGVMVARGDLGVRLPLEDVPHIQKQIIRSAVGHGKPAITATQMLESMVQSPSPTRAEATDVANAVFDGTTAVMLSAETAIGHDPVLVIKTMSHLCQRAEENADYSTWGSQLGRIQGLVQADQWTRITAGMSHAAWRLATELELDAILSCTNSGYTARAISRFRPPGVLVGASPYEETVRKLSLVWGTKPLKVDEYATTDEMVWHVVEKSVQAGYVKHGDLVAVLAGAPDTDGTATDVLRVVTVA